MRPQCARTNAVHGQVRWDAVKSVWYLSHVTISLCFAWLCFSWSAAVTACLLTCVTMCAGHSVGMHRLLIHRSFDCTVLLERTLVTLGVLVGMGGPRKMLYMHDIRDWSQRQPECHPFFIHQRGIVTDWWWNLNCQLDLDDPPAFEPEPCTCNWWYRLLDAGWMVVQLPLAAVLYLVGGLEFVVWGISVRLALSLTGHWLVGYLAHNGGHKEWHVHGASVQGSNVPGLGVITFGEAWHNNHHAFPESARLGLKPGQSDPGWWMLTVLEGLGLVWNLHQPADLPHRPELERIESEEAQHSSRGAQNTEALTEQLSVRLVT